MKNSNIKIIKNWRLLYKLTIEKDKGKSLIYFLYNRRKISFILITIKLV